MLERTAYKSYTELIDNQIYVRSELEVETISFDCIEDIKQQIELHAKPNLIIFFEDHGNENVFSKWSYISLYKIILSCKPVSVRIFDESCSSGGFIKCMTQYNNIFKLLNPSNSQDEIDIKNISLFTKMLNSSKEIKESISELISISSKIHELYIKDQTEIDKAFHVLRDVIRNQYKIIKDMPDELEINNSKFNLRIKYDKFCSLANLGIQTIHEIKLLRNVFRYIHENTNFEIVSFSEFSSLFNEDNIKKYFSLVKQFDSENDFTELIDYYFMGDILHPPVKDFKVVTSSNSKNSSSTFPSFRINPVTKVIAGTPLIASAIEEVFLNITHEPINTHLIENWIIENPADKENDDGKKFCCWHQAFIESYSSSSNCADRLLICAVNILKEKAAVMRVATEIIDIVIKNVQESIGYSGEVQIQIPKSSSKDRMTMPKDAVTAAIAEKRLQTIVGLSAIIPFASMVNQQKLKNMMASYRINKQQKTMINFIKAMELNPTQMMIESERTMNMITDTIKDVVGQEKKNNIVFVDAITTFIKEEAFVAASISSLFQLQNDHGFIEHTLFNVLKDEEFSNMPLLKEVINIAKNSKLTEGESTFQIIQCANEVLKSNVQEAMKDCNTLMEDTIENILQKLLDNECFVHEQKINQYLDSFDQSDVDKAKRKLECLCNRAAAIVFDNVDVNNRNSQEEILDDGFAIDSRFPDACDAIMHFIDPSVYLMQMLLTRQKELTDANKDYTDDQTIQLLRKQISSNNRINERVVARNAYKAACFLSELLKKYLDDFIDTIKEKILDHDFNIVSVFEMGAQILSDEEIVANKLKMMCDQLREADIHGLFSITSMIARSIRTYIAVTAMSASIPREPDEIKALLSLSDNAILAEASKALTKVQLDIKMELTGREKELVLSASHQLLKNKEIAEMAEIAAFEVLINTQLLSKYPVEYVVEFMERLRKFLSKDDLELCQKALINITRNDIIHLLGLTRFQRIGKPGSTIRYTDKRADPSSFDYSKSPPQPTIEHDSDDETGSECCTQFLLIHFKYKEPKPGKQNTSFVRKPLTDNDFIILTNDLNVPQNGWGPDVIKVIEARFQNYVSQYGLTFDKSKVIRCNDEYFIRAEVEGYKILPLYNIIEYKKNKLFYAGFFVQNRKLRKELFDCFVQSVDDADRLVTPFYFPRLQYYKYY